MGEGAGVTVLPFTSSTKGVKVGRVKSWVGMRITVAVAVGSGVLVIVGVSVGGKVGVDVGGGIWQSSRIAGPVLRDAERHLADRDAVGVLETACVYALVVAFV